MLTTLLVAAALTHSPISQNQSESAGSIISQMLAKYNEAKTLVGRITLTQGALGQSGQVVTELQMELPSKLYIRQSKSTGGKVALVTSNGVFFSYPAPKPPWKNADEAPRLVEHVKNKDKVLSCRDIYAATALSLIDRCAPLDIAMGRKEDLEYLRNQWATVTYRGTVKKDDEEMHVIMGNWREYGTAPVSGQYRMIISKSGDLREYALSEQVMLAGAPQNVLSTWAVNVDIDGKPDPALFKLVR